MLFFTEGLLAGGILPTIPDILIHLLNFIILAVLLYFLIYKPVKRMIAKRQEAVKQIEEENLTLNAEVKKMKEEFDVLIDDAKKDAARIQHEAVESANKKSAKILQEAKAKSREMTMRTEAEMQSELKKLEGEIKSQISSVSADVAEKILGREISEADNERLIQDSLKKWRGSND